VTGTSFDRLSKAAAVARASIAVAVATTVAVAVIGAGVAGAQATGGGTAPPGDPAITDVLCVTKCIKPRKGVIGSKVRIIGSDLQQVRVVSLPRSDGKRAKDMSPYVKPSGAVLAYVKAGAITGAVRVADSYGQRKDSPAAFKIGTKAQLRKARQKYKFPVPGPHQYWDGLGAGRGHQGQDIGAACKSRIIVAHSGKVIERSGAGPEGAAGNYVMIFNRRDNRTHTYMHLFNPPAVARGDAVTTGQFLGKVGETGRASGCHLHFELRAGRGWGQVLNPTPLLRTWDKYS
jgi:murein DD-endopeptidase MepM/ murein hydrolase activator NlpD